MRLKEITEEFKQKVISIYNEKDLSWDERMSSLGQLFGGISERNVRKWK